jgi:endoglucanase
MLLAALAAAVIAVGTFFIGGILPGLSSVNPFAGKLLYLNPDSSAAKAYSTATGTPKDTIAVLAQTPTATWILPEAHATADVASYVSGVASDAEAAGQLPLLVIYGITNRDCSDASQANGGQSAGGLPAADYTAWVAQIANGLVGHPAVVVLEPDSLALSDQCPDPGARVAQVKAAVEQLNAVDKKTIAIYLDGGHSSWKDAATQASLLNAAGVGEVRGFASNVSNFNSTADEEAYDQKVSSLTGGAHYVIDTSRNGNGGTTDWCNPPGRAIGQAPAVISNGTGEDALLWIKNPGESDGTCNGGPAAGDWWQAGAEALVTK